MISDVSKIAKKYPNAFRIASTLLFATFIAALLIIIGAIQSGSTYYYFMLYNLALAYFPLIFAVWLIYRLKTSPWLSPGNVILSILWLAFLPNSFYMISDLIHAQQLNGVGLLYNIVLIMMCAFNALVAGFISLYLVHWALLKRFYYKNVHFVIAIVFLICSFAIYLGRDLRWNSWDVVVNPFGLLFDISDTISNPATHPDVFATTASFFLLLGTMYLVIWNITKSLKKTKQYN